MPDNAAYRITREMEEFPTKIEANEGRGRFFRRKMRAKHIDRKKAIIRKYSPDNLPAQVDATFNPRNLEDIFAPNGGLYEKAKIMRSLGSCAGYWSYKHEGQLSKGKIHCSCPLCAFHGPTHQDIRILLKMESEIDEEGSAENDVLTNAVINAKGKLRRRQSTRVTFKGSGLAGTSLGTDTQTHIFHIEEKAKEKNYMRPH